MSVMAQYMLPQQVGIMRFTKFKVIRGHNSENTCRTTIIPLHAYSYITSMCTKFDENPFSGVGVARTKSTEFKVSGAITPEILTINRMAFIALYANLQICTSMCAKFGEIPSSGVGDE